MTLLDSKAIDWSITNAPTFRHSLPIRYEADLEDAIQDAWIKLRAHPSITLALLNATIVNCYKDRAKAESRRKSRERCRHGRVDDVNLHRFGTNDKSPFDRTQLSRAVDDGWHDPFGHLWRQERRRAIKRAVRAARLSRDHRCALWAWLRGRVAEFARRRGVPKVTVRVWAKRARDALRPHLKRAGLQPEGNRFN